MLISDLKDQKILIWGMGSEGKSVYDYLARHQVSSFIETYNDDEGELGLNKVWKREVIIRSPAVSIKKQEKIKAKEKGIKITSSAD